MTFEEAKKVVENLVEIYEGEENAVRALYILYAKDKISSGDLEAFINILGYGFTDEFANMTEEEKKAYCLKELEEASYKNADENGEKEPETKAEDDKETKETKEPSTKDDSSDDSEDDDKKAARLFGFGGKDKDKDKK